MRVALCEALDRRGEGEDESGDEMMDAEERVGGVVCMPQLKEVVSVGTKKGNLATSETGKHFIKVCKGRKIKWVVH